MALHHIPQHALALLTGLALLAALGAAPITLLLLTATLGCAILAAVLREPRSTTRPHDCTGPGLVTRDRGKTEDQPAR
ncbi:hypothetical protein AB0H49_07310 [Nocardia sp. NPDC050713]|uniref:hypothetical protein n=1 Tax=Nocardia sp. NPDC050713 TaxID=3154511 RepID=UPI00340CAA2B